MKTEWDYTTLAEAYLNRPNYSEEVIDKILLLVEVAKGDKVCDVGAGTAHLTIQLVANGLDVTAIEPNNVMRENGIKRTSALRNVKWFEGTGEQTEQPSDSFKLVTFGSSFNVTNRQEALKETYRILEPGGWFVCLWNHRDLDDPIQKEIENIIKLNIEGYGYGTRREDQTIIIKQSQLFGEVHKIEGRVLHRQALKDCVEAWRSHATLARQAGEKFDAIVDEIARLLISKQVNEITIPYTTRVWAAQLIAK